MFRGFLGVPRALGVPRVLGVLRVLGFLGFRGSGSWVILRVLRVLRV